MILLTGGGVPKGGTKRVVFHLSFPQCCGDLGGRFERAVDCAGVTSVILFAYHGVEKGGPATRYVDGDPLLFPAPRKIS